MIRIMTRIALVSICSGVSGINIHQSKLPGMATKYSASHGAGPPADLFKYGKIHHFPWINPWKSTISMAIFKYVQSLCHKSPEGSPVSPVSSHLS